MSKRLHQQTAVQRYALRMQALGELPFVGGNPALDFTNTAEERGHPLCGEVLHTPDDLWAWGHRYGIADQSANSEDPDAELAQAIIARELLYRLWFSRVHGGADKQGDLRQLAHFTIEAHAAGSLGTVGDGQLDWRWDRSELASIRHVAVTSAVAVLTARDTPRLQQCPGDHCGWFFLDPTKRGHRRWCLMSECGQDAKTANRRRRVGAMRVNPG